jgi:hypothetical protein
MQAFWFDLPGTIDHSAILWRCAQLSIALPVNSGPFSLVITTGTLRVEAV